MIVRHPSRLLATLAWCVLLLFALAVPSFVSAQSSDRIATLEISVWPEFDDPRVLVQFDGELATEDGYPRDIAFYIPASAVLNATAYADEQQTLFNTDPPAVAEAGNGLKRVTFRLPKPHFHLEYYDDAIKGAPDRSLAFAYHALLPADQVSIQVQQPLKAENFVTFPAAALQSEGAHDFKYHIFIYPGIAADQQLELQINYTKTDPNPSIQNVVVPASAANQTAPASNEEVPTEPKQLIVLVASAVAFAVALLALWMWYARRQPRLAFANGNAKQSKGGKGERGSSGFCSQCGNALHTGDNFCPKCGAKRRN